MPNTHNVRSSNIERADDAIVSMSASAEGGSESIQARSVSELASEFALEKPLFKSISLADNLDTDGSSFKLYAADRAIDASSRLGVPLFAESGDLTRHKVVTKAGLVKRASQDKADIQPQLLLWKFNEYAVAAQHVLCTAEVKELRAVIESTLNAKAIEFCRESGLSYKCEAWRNNTKVSLCVQVSKLQSTCQKLTGKQFLVEVKRSRRCADPFVWRSFATELLDAFRSALASSTPRKPRSNTLEFQELIDQKSMDMNSRQISRKYSLGKEDTVELTRKCVMQRGDLCEVIDRFLVARDKNDVSLSSAETCEIIAGLSKELGKVPQSAQILSREAFDSFSFLLTSSCFDLRKATCTIIANVARAGLLWKFSDKQMDVLMRSLTRSILSLDMSVKFTVAFMREAIKAIVTVYNTANDDVKTSFKSHVRGALQLCSKSQNKGLSSDATDALETLGLGSSTETAQLSS